jgi:hypothetical protein
VTIAEHLRRLTGDDTDWLRDWNDALPAGASLAAAIEYLDAYESAPGGAEPCEQQAVAAAVPA